MTMTLYLIFLVFVLLPSSGLVTIKLKLADRHDNNNNNKHDSGDRSGDTHTSVTLLSAAWTDGSSDA